MKKGYQLLDMIRNVLRIATIYCLASGILFSDRASAMLPVGNDAHRRFYKDQEWIWTSPEQPKMSVGENADGALQSVAPELSSQGV